MKRHVRLEVPCVAALALALSACGGGVSPGPQGVSPSPVGPSAPGTSTSAGPSGATASAASATATVAAADVTANDGFKYHILVTSAPTAVTQVKVNRGLDPRDAPPGQEFVTLNVEVTNLTDREEPLEDLYFANDWSSKMIFGIPMADSAAFGFHPDSSSGDLCEFQRVTAGVCSLGGALQSVSPAPSDRSSPQIAPGPDSKVTLLLGTTRAMPSTAPLTKLQLMLVDPIRGGVLARLPIPSR
jgi:hypothetical protein